MSEFTYDESATLERRGYQPTWLGRIKDGDHVAFKPYGGKTALVEFWIVSELHVASEATWDHNAVLSFLATDDEGVTVHKRYGASWECFVLQDGGEDERAD